MLPLSKQLNYTFRHIFLFFAVAARELREFDAGYNLFPDFVMLLLLSFILILLSCVCILKKRVMSLTFLFGYQQCTENGCHQIPGICNTFACTATQLCFQHERAHVQNLSAKTWGKKKKRKPALSKGLQVLKTLA